MTPQKFFGEIAPGTTEAEYIAAVEKSAMRQAIISELQAIEMYESMAMSVVSPDLKKILNDIAREEKVHVGEFTEMLARIDREYDQSVIEGRNEARSKTAGEVGRWR